LVKPQLPVSAGEISSAATAAVRPNITVGRTPVPQPPRIKSALLTPSMAQRLGVSNRGASGTSSSMRCCRSPGKSVKRLQASPRSVRSPMRPLSPSHVSAATGSTNGSSTVAAVPFDLDI
jgi:hypothetical protein